MCRLIAMTITMTSERGATHVPLSAEVPKIPAGHVGRADETEPHDFQLGSWI